jgi:GNAT superfamily N-acetyltransferase
MSFSVRRAQIADVDTLADGLADFLIDLNYFRRLEGLSAEQVRARVRDHLNLSFADGSHSVYVAEAAGANIVGYTAVHWLPYLFLPGPEGYVSELFVAQAARGQGVGTRLLATVKEEARARGCSRLSLLNMRDRESYQRRFYAKDGWEERSDAANFVFDMSTLQRD